MIRFRSLRCGLGSALVGCLLSLFVPVLFGEPTPLEQLKTPYDEQVSKIYNDFDAKVQNLNQQYARSLQTLNDQYKRAGDLDPLLVVRKELDRFKEFENVGTPDVVSLASVAGLQRNYIETKTSMRKDRDSRISKLATAYLAQLEQLKKTLTQQDKIAAAMAVQQEQELVRSSVNLSAAETPAATSPPVAPPVRSTPVPAAGTAPMAVATGSDNICPYAMRPPKGYIWLYVTDRGMGAKNVGFFFEAESDGKVTEQASDSLGKVSFLAQAGRYRLLLLDEHYAKVEMSGLKEGDAYAIKLQAPARNQGVAEFHNKTCVLPEIGRLTWAMPNYMYYNDRNNNEHWVHAENPRVKIKGGSTWNSTGPNGQTYSAVSMSHNRTNTVQLGEITYEVNVIVMGDRWFLEYRKQ